MNQKQLLIQRRKKWFEYHIPGMTNLHRIKKNAVFISAANSLGHEMKKLELCYGLRKLGREFITEAERNRKAGEARVKVDIVDLDTGKEWEIETTKSRAKGLIEDEKVRDVEVIRLWEGKKGQGTLR